MTATAPMPPAIAPLPAGTQRPRWSVMIPVRNRLDFLEQCLRSVLNQAPEPEEMQIEVVDNSTRESGVEDFVRHLGGTRVSYFRQPRDVGMAENWNTCIERARGHLVHILHDDDWVASEFYARLSEAANRFPEAAVFLSRCFVTDEAGGTFAVTPQMHWLERGSRDIAPNYGENQIYCPGVVVRRAHYEAAGGFSERWGSATDYVRWMEAIHLAGAVALPEAWCHYRMGTGNLTAELWRTGGNVTDLWRAGRHLATLCPSLDRNAFHLACTQKALGQYYSFKSRGDQRAAGLNLQVWATLASRQERLRAPLAALLKQRWASVKELATAALGRPRPESSQRRPAPQDLATK